MRPKVQGSWVLRKWVLRKINAFLLLLFLMASTAFAAQYFMHNTGMGPASGDGPQNISIPEKNTLKNTLPPSFVQSQDQYNAILGPFLALEKDKHAGKLPDIRNSLIYYGKNLRPDSIKDRAACLMGFRGDMTLNSVPSGEKIYLSPLQKGNHSRWIFSEENRPTSIWFTIEPLNDMAHVQLRMVDHQGRLIEEPAELASFTVKECPMPLNTPMNSGWTIGTDAVDNAFLQKQKAKWYGQDLFLEEFGGNEYSFTVGKERVQFDRDDGAYAVFVREGDALTYEDGTWVELPLGAETEGKPLLVVKKVEDRRMLFDLWDEAGKRRAQLELQKTIEPALSSQKLDIKLIGARSKTTWIVSIAGKRTQVKSDDWLLFQNGGFEIIRTPEEIDEYIEGRLKGNLLVLTQVGRDQSGPSLTGDYFSASHSQMDQIEIVMQSQIDKRGQNGSPSGAQNGSQGPWGKKTSHTFDDDDDDDEDSDIDVPDDDDISDDDDEDFQYV